MTEETFQPPEDRITITIKGEPKEFFMSAGLIRRLVSYVQSSTDFSDIYSNVALQEVMMIEVVADRSERGKPIEDQLDLRDYEIPIGDDDKLLDWINGHVFGFFIRSASKVEAEVKSPTSNLQKLMHSTNGLVALAQEKLSAGDTAANSVTST